MSEHASQLSSLSTLPLGLHHRGVPSCDVKGQQFYLRLCPPSPQRNSVPESQLESSYQHVSEFTCDYMVQKSQSTCPLLTYFLGVLDALITVKTNNIYQTYAGSLVCAAIKATIIFLWNAIRILRLKDTPRNCPVHASIPNPHQS